MSDRWEEKARQCAFEQFVLLLEIGSDETVERFVRVHRKSIQAEITRIDSEARREEAEKHGPKTCECGPYDAGCTHRWGAKR